MAQRSSRAAPFGFAVSTWRVPLVGAAAIALLGFTAITTASLTTPQSNVAPAVIDTRDAVAALRRLDTETIVQMCKAGWNPNRPIDKDGNVPLGIAVEMCEWHPGHDSEQLLLMVRTLYDAGARVDVAAPLRSQFWHGFRLRPWLSGIKDT